jgi:peptidoglycan/LPS O-acetylase OafA/YrhL
MRLKIIDYLKGYSISTIVLFHLLQYFALPNILSKAINFGGTGVHIFILCSGFGLCLSQLNKPLDYIQFLKRRFVKVYVPYITVILVSVTISFIYDHDDRLLALLSHIFLFKMFFQHLMESFGTQFWFISLIICLYLVFIPLYKIIRTHELHKAIIISLLISFSYATFVVVIGKSELRVWNSFFLQYLWEFVLGIILAIKYKENHSYVQIPAKKYLVIFAVLGITIIGITGYIGGVLKMFNDIPSLVGYLSLALLIYSFHIKWINNFFVYTNQISYEWFLIHILIFVCIFHFLGISVLNGILALGLSYICAILYNELLKCILKK